MASTLCRQRCDWLSSRAVYQNVGELSYHTYNLYHTLAARYPVRIAAMPLGGVPRERRKRKSDTPIKSRPANSNHMPLGHKLHHVMQCNAGGTSW